MFELFEKTQMSMEACVILHYLILIS